MKNRPYCLLVTTLLLGLSLASKPFALSPLSTAKASDTRIICLDPGHGGSATGAIYNQNGIYIEEKDLNLDIAKRLEVLLEQDPNTVVELTRRTDQNLTNTQRADYCNSINADILISIHHNGSNDSSVDGTLGLYHSRKDDKILAQKLQEVMYTELNPNSDPNIGDWEFTDFGVDLFASGVLIKSKMPAALMEPIFLTNDNEAQLLLDTSNNSRRQQIAEAYLAGINEYFASGGGGKCPPGNPNHPHCN